MKKLNLRALKTSEPEPQNQQEVSQNVSKDSIIPRPVTQEKSLISEKQEIQPDTTQDQTNIPQKELKQEDHSSAKISFSAMKERKAERIEEKKMQVASKKVKEVNETSQTETQRPKEIVHFDNYESSFKKASGNSLKKLRNFKYAPKTRIWLLLGLIWISTITIASLMVLAPDKHSIEIYKTSLLEIYQVKTSANQVKQLGTATIVPTTNNLQNQESALQKDSQAKKIDAQKQRLKKHLIDKYSN